MQPVSVAVQHSGEGSARGQHHRGQHQVLAAVRGEIAEGQREPGRGVFTEIVRLDVLATGRRQASLAAQQQARLRTSKYRASQAYRHEMVAVLMRRVLNRAVERAKSARS